MDAIGTLVIERINDEYGHPAVRILNADPRIRIDRDLACAIRDNRSDAYAPWLTLDGDVLTIRDDYGQRVIYRIRWDECADGGYLAGVA